MEAYNQRIMDALEISSTVPSIVDEKCQEAYRNILETPAKRLKIKKHLAAKICLPIAACFALIVGIGFTNPALAEQIPVVKNVVAPIKNVFALFRSDSIKNKDPLLHGDQADYAQQVVMNSESSDTDQLKVKIEQLYCDGYNLNITYSMELNDKTLRKYEEFYFFKEVDKLNGEKVQKRTVLRFQKNADGTYVAVQQINLNKVANLTDTFEYSVALSDLKGSDNDELVAETIPSPQNKNAVAYTPKQTPISGNWNFDFQGCVDRSGNRIYTINQTDHEMTLNQVILTPSSTIVEYELPITWGDDQGHILSFAHITDDKGNDLQPSMGQPTKLTDTVLERTTFSETSPDAKILSVEITTKDKEPANFTVPLK